MFKILHVTNSLGTGGAERLLVNLARHVDRSRFKLSVCCTRRDGPTRRDLEEAGCEVVVLDKPRRSSLLFPLFCADVVSMGAGILGVMRANRPDLVHSHLEANFIAPFCARMAGVKAVVASFHSSVEMPARSRWSLRNVTRRFLLGRMANIAGALVAGSEYAGKAVAEECGLSADKMQVIYNGVDVSRLARVTPHTAIREELGLPVRELLIATLGTVREPKNHKLLVRAMRLVSEARCDVSAIAIGGGFPAFVEEVRGLVVRLGLQGKIHFLGYREDAHSILKACDLFVLPSLWEGLPLAALEAMACGLPVIVSDIPPHKELIEHGVDGLLFRSDDEVSLADTIIAGLADPQRSRDMAEAALHKVRARYDSAQMARSYEQLYEQCLTRR